MFSFQGAFTGEGSLAPADVRFCGKNASHWSVLVRKLGLSAVEGRVFVTGSKTLPPCLLARGASEMVSGRWLGR